MKYIIKFIAAILVAISSIGAFSQIHPSINNHRLTANNKTTTSGNNDIKPIISGTKTETFIVSGNCNMCKANIEKASQLEGASRAEWNKETRKLTIVYNTNVITTETVLKNIADAGYDNEKFKAEDKAYNALHKCCQYDRNLQGNDSLK